MGTANAATRDAGHGVNFEQSGVNERRAILAALGHVLACTEEVWWST